MILSLRFALRTLPPGRSTRWAKPGSATFMANLERELLRLERQLQDGSYRPGRYVENMGNDLE